MALVKEKVSYFFRFSPKLKMDNVDYSLLVFTNKEGFSPEGQQKIIDFFTIPPGLSKKIKYRKLLSFILLQQQLSGKDVVIEDDSLCKFSGIPRKELLYSLYYLSKKVHLIKGRKKTYRLPEYLWNTDILKKIKKLEKK